MVLWETKFFAISNITGRLEEYEGMLIKANNLLDASMFLRKQKGTEYLQLTGIWYQDMQAYVDENTFLDKLVEFEKPLKGMSFDDLYDWLKKAPTVDDLKLAKDRILQEGGMEDYIPLIDRLISEYEERERKEGGEETSY